MKNGIKLQNIKKCALKSFPVSIYNIYDYYILNVIQKTKKNY